MGPVIDARHGECIYGIVNSDLTRGCSLADRALLYPACGCASCTHCRPIPRRAIKNRDKRHAMRLTDD
jgi:hypothetical protein